MTRIHRTVAFLLFSSLSSLSAAGCSEAVDDDVALAQTEEALTSLPNGTFAIAARPAHGSYVARLTLAPGKKFEIEYVRRRTTTEPWVFNPWISVPVTREEAVVLRGSWFTYEGDGGRTMASFDVTDGSGGDEHFIFAVETAPSIVRLTTIDDRTFELRASSAPPAPTDVRVLRCEGHRIEAVITLDEAQRRRGTIAIVRKPGADSTSPPETTAAVVFTGRTGVDDYMRYEGRDAAGNGYDFALRERELERTSGQISNVGLGFSPNDWLAGGAYHNSLTCTIARR